MMMARVGAVSRSDVISVAAAGLLVAAAGVVGFALLAAGVRLEVYAPPLFGWVAPRVGPGTPAVVVIAVIALLFARRVALLASWRRVVIIGYPTALAWTVALALVDGWSGGLGSRLAGGHEYLRELGRVGSVRSFLAGFTDLIIDQPGSWTTHVAGHPPAATLVFWLLDRIGLGGGDWAAVLILLVGASAAVAVPVTVRALGAPRAARRMIVFSVFLPGTLWLAVSADGMFAGVAASGLALVVLGCRSRRASWPLPALAGGLLLGLLLYLSYGLIVFGLVVLVAAGLTVRTDGWAVLRRWAVAAVAVLAVAAAFTGAGFAWWEGLSRLHVRYYQGVGGVRPYGYFVWANLAAFVIMIGPIVVAALARAVPVLLPRRESVGCGAGLVGVGTGAGRGGVGGPSTGSGQDSTGSGDGSTGSGDGGTGSVRRGTGSARGAERLVPAVLGLAGLVAVLLADLSGLSKAETERIWLPFGYVAVAATALLPARAARWGLGLSVALTVAVAHLVWTPW